jgi:hypothetical protein
MSFFFFQVGDCLIARGGYTSEETALHVLLKSNVQEIRNDDNDVSWPLI